MLTNFKSRKKYSLRASSNDKGMISFPDSNRSQYDRVVLVYEVEKTYFFHIDYFIYNIPSYKEIHVFESRLPPNELLQMPTKIQFSNSNKKFIYVRAHFNSRINFTLDETILTFVTTPRYFVLDGVIFPKIASRHSNLKNNNHIFHRIILIHELRNVNDDLLSLVDIFKDKKAKPTSIKSQKISNAYGELSTEENKNLLEKIRSFNSYNELLDFVNNNDSAFMNIEFILKQYESYEKIKKRASNTSSVDDVDFEENSSNFFPDENVLDGLSKVIYTDNNPENIKKYLDPQREQEIKEALNNINSKIPDIKKYSNIVKFLIYHYDIKKSNFRKNKPNLALQEVSKYLPPEILEIYKQKEFI